MSKSALVNNKKEDLKNTENQKTHFYKAVSME